MCGISFAMPQDFQLVCRLDHNQEFYCPNGHGQVYIGKTEAQKERALRESAERDREYYQVQLRRTREELKSTERSRAAIKGQNTKIKKRIANGVCPCCNRHFAALEKHMATKHPDYVVPE
jgi:hypothetical protein